MNKLFLSFCLITSVSTATVTKSFFGSNKAAEQQCKRCGTAIALREFLREVAPHNAAPTHTARINEYIEKNCTSSDKEIQCAITYCEDQSLNAMPNFWSDVTKGQLSWDPIKATTNVVNFAENWRNAADRLKTQLREPKSKSTKTN